MPASHECSLILLVLREPGFRYEEANVDEKDGGCWEIIVNEIIRQKG